LIWKLLMDVFTILQEKSMKPVLALSYLGLSAALIPAAGFAQSAPAHQATADSAQAAANSAQAAANSAQATANSAQATVPQNTEIASKIEAEMASQNVASVTGINVSADSSGVVSLTGSARSQDDIDKVVSIAQNTAGVSAVNNSVRVQPQ
jgi:hyperosmotically inducible periplasmic protein